MFRAGDCKLQSQLGDTPSSNIVSPPFSRKVELLFPVFWVKNPLKIQFVYLLYLSDHVDSVLVLKVLSIYEFLVPRFLFW